MSTLAETTTESALEGVPPFRLVFPRGWRQHDLSEETERAMMAQARGRFLRMHRPDLELELAATMKRSFRQMRANRVFAVYLPTELGSAEDIVPMSLSAALMEEPNGGTLDARITDIFRRGGEFLGDTKDIVRWTAPMSAQSEFRGVGGTQIYYAIPVLGSDRRRAVLFSMSILDDPSQTADDEFQQAMILLSDSIIGTFSWLEPRPRAVEG